MTSGLLLWATGVPSSYFQGEENVLCLSRKLNERIVIAGGFENGGVTITVLEVNGDRVKLGIQADKAIAVHRQEVWVRIQQEGRAA